MFSWKNVHNFYFKLVERIKHIRYENLSSVQLYRFCAKQEPPLALEPACLALVMAARLVVSESVRLYRRSHLLAHICLQWQIEPVLHVKSRSIFKVAALALTREVLGSNGPANEFGLGNYAPAAALSQNQFLQLGIKNAENVWRYQATHDLKFKF